MKKIIYITTTMNEEDYVDYMEHWKIKPNPSNQNFHNKFIRSLAIDNFVDVISILNKKKKYYHFQEKL